MSVYLVYVLIVLALAGGAGVVFKLGEGLGSILMIIGAIVVAQVLWDPVIKPRLEKWSKK